MSQLFNTTIRQTIHIKRLGESYTAQAGGGKKIGETHNDRYA